MNRPPFASRVALALFVFAAACGTAAVGHAAEGERAAEAAKQAFFKQRVQPVLVKHCYACHSDQAPKVEGGLRLDFREAARRGGDTGPAVVPGDLKASLLWSAVRYEGLEMPPAGRLPDAVLADLRQWILSGAADPRDAPPGTPGDGAEPDYTDARQFWAFRPVSRPAVPEVENRGWPRTAIDHFVLARLEARRLAPEPSAARAQLIRRVTFDVTGLPPTPEEVQAFVADTSPQAYPRLVDRLLASPRYGERWGQHWLDVVRFAETEGFEYDRLLAGAWRYRDYVIDAFNRDKPYDQFLTEQLAGDELDPNDPQLRVAAGFHRLGPVRRNAGNQKVASSRNEVLTERTDIVGAAFLGLTVGCARCHDHKFDPIPQRDYYRLQAFLAATFEDNVSLASEAEQQRWRLETEQIEGELKQLKAKLAAQSVDEQTATTARIQQLEQRLPAPLPTLCSVRHDAQQRTAMHLLRRGDPELPGPPVGMRGLGVLVDPRVEELPADTAQPRTALARWLADPAHPLTARVMVNRIWQAHFGQGLVATANDFGANGQRPSHPELLDYLAAELTETHRWQLKPLHRQILLSSVYRQAAGGSAAARAQDPDNRLLARFTRRRLSSEEIRDAMLAVSGTLNLKSGGPSVIPPVDPELVRQLYKPTQWKVTAEAAEHRRRSIYLIAKRNLRLPFMEVFDQPTAQTSCARREESTHAPQALELLNGALVNDLAGQFAARLSRECGDDHAAWVARAYALAAGRPPTPRERQLAVAFLQQNAGREFALAMFNLNAFLYVD